MPPHTRAFVTSSWYWRIVLQRCFTPGAVALVISMLFLPPAIVQRAWLLPLYINFAIPITLLGLLLVTRNTLAKSE